MSSNPQAVLFSSVLTDTIRRLCGNPVTGYTGVFEAQSTDGDGFPRSVCLKDVPFGKPGEQFLRERKVTHLRPRVQTVPGLVATFSDVAPKLSAFNVQPTHMLHTERVDNDGQPEKVWIVLWVFDQLAECPSTPFFNAWSLAQSLLYEGKSGRVGEISTLPVPCEAFTVFTLVKFREPLAAAEMAKEAGKEAFLRYLGVTQQGHPFPEEAKVLNPVIVETVHHAIGDGFISDFEIEALTRRIGKQLARQGFKPHPDFRVLSEGLQRVMRVYYPGAAGWAGPSMLPALADALRAGFILHEIETQATAQG